MGARVWLIALVVCVALVLPSVTCARTTGYIGGDAGLFYIMGENFDEIYDSAIGPVLGATAGFYITDEVSLVGKFRYFSKSGEPIVIEERETLTSSYTESWFLGAVRYDLDIGTDSIVPWIEAGAGFFSVEESMEAYGLTVSATDNTVGLELAGGLAYNIAPNVSIGASVEYCAAMIQSEGGVGGEAGEDVNVGGFTMLGNVSLRF